MALNRVQLIGRLGKDPEIRAAGSSDVCNFSVATEERWKDKRSGETKTHTDWHNIVVWNEGTIKFIEKNVFKGDLVFVEGKLQTRDYEDKDGNKRYVTEVVIKPFNGELQKLNWEKKDDDDRGGDRGERRSRGRDDGDDRRSSRDRDDRGGDRGGRGGGKVQSGRRTSDDIDDDIPF